MLTIRGTYEEIEKKKFLLELSNKATFFLNVLFPNTMVKYSLNPKQQEKNRAQTRGGSAHTFLETPCTLDPN